MSTNEASLAAGPVEQKPRDGPITKAARRRSMFWLSFWMGVMLAYCKFYYVGGPSEWSGKELGYWLVNLGIVAHRDVLYALGVGLAGQMLLWGTRRWRRVQTVVWWGLIGLCVASVIYAVVAVRVFMQLRMPLTYTLIQLAGDAKNMKSSVAVYFTPGVAAALIGLPVLYGVLAWMGNRWLTPRRTWWVRGMQVAGAGLIVFYAVAMHKEAEGAWGSKHDDRRIADNPHVVLAASYVKAWLGDKPVVLNENFPQSFLEDFKTVEDRGAGGGAPTPGLKRGPKNVILIVLESVGTQHLGLYGGEFKTTPNLEREAADALVFDNFYTHVQNTANSLVAITLGVYPMDPRSMWRERTVHSVDMPGITPAAALKEKGYRTAFISAGDNKWKNQDEFLKGRGFDDVWDYRQSGCVLRDEFSWGVEDKCVVDMVLKWTEQDKSRPFFVMAWTQGTHHPYEPYPGQEEIAYEVSQEKWGNMWWDLGRYLNSLYEMDRQLGRLLAEIRKRGMEKDTVVIIVGDHGEGFSWPHKMSVGHSGNVYQEDVNVPFLIWSPELFKGAGRSKTVGAHVDIGPTILDLMGVQCPGPWQGRSVLGGGERRAYFYGAMDNYMLGVREGDWKYVLNVTRGTDELYDVANDRHELKNLAAENVEKASQLRQRVAAWVEYQKRMKWNRSE